MPGEKESALIAALVEMREDEALALARSFIADGQPPARLLELSRMAMEAIGKRFEDGEYFLPELMMAGEMLAQIAELVRPHLAQSATTENDAAKPVVLIGTVQGDLHDIGKNIVVFMLEVNGFKVVDLGIDVPVGTFVDKVREIRPAVVGLSGFLTLAFDAMRDTVQAFHTAGLRDNIKVMIGGGQVDEAIRKYTGADAYGSNAMAAVNLCQGWLGKAA
jgi:5-methyltetrahydrofolate--homocysteine methyltransferase